MSVLNSENYFSIENQMIYLGASQVKAMIQCEAMAMAELRGEFVRRGSTALLVGSYVDAHFEGTLDVFKAKNPEIFTKGGGLKAEYRHAEAIIERVSRDDYFMKYMSGEKQVIKTAEIAGMPFKIKIDSYHAGRCIVDLKIMKDFNDVWVDDVGKLNFIEAWGYDVQGAIYQAVEGNNLPFYIAAATKEPEPNLEIFHVEQEYLDAAMAVVLNRLPRIKKVKAGEVVPSRCGKCDYCKSTKVLDGVVGLSTLRGID